MELHECYCRSKEHGTNSKSQSKGLPCWAHFLVLEFLVPEFLVPEFFVDPFDIGKHLLEKVFGVRHRDRPRATRGSRGASVRAMKQTTRLARFGSARQCGQSSFDSSNDHASKSGLNEDLINDAADDAT